MPSSRIVARGRGIHGVDEACWCPGRITCGAAASGPSPRPRAPRPDAAHDRGRCPGLDSHAERRHVVGASPVRVSPRPARRVALMASLNVTSRSRIIRRSCAATSASRRDGGTSSEHHSIIVLVLRCTRRRPGIRVHGIRKPLRATSIRAASWLGAFTGSRRGRASGWRSSGRRAVRSRPRA